MSFTKKMNNIVDLADSFMNYAEGAYETARAEYKAYKRIAAIGTLVLGAACIGVMYVRFRIFGG